MRFDGLRRVELGAPSPLAGEGGTRAPERQRRSAREDEGSRGGSGAFLRGWRDPSPGCFAPPLSRRGRGLPGRPEEVQTGA